MLDFGSARDGLVSFAFMAARIGSSMRIGLEKEAENRDIQFNLLFPTGG